jgi:two-component system response regulator YesN
LEYTLLDVLIVDDELIVREGLKYVIDWTALGFCICDDAATGEEAIRKIKKYNPDLILLDIRMPDMDGTDLIEQVRKNGYTGDFIIISGYSDFKYAQTALHYGASFYLTKPIDEEALAKAVSSVKDKIIKSREKEKSLSQYRTKAKATVIRDLLQGSEPNDSINYLEMGLYAPIYQVVIYEGFHPYFTAYNFADLLKVTNQGNSSFEHIILDNRNIILLKGTYAIDRLNTILAYYKNGTQKGSPLDSVFLACGRTVSELSEIGNSYEDCRLLMARRFFCEENQHVLSYEVLTGLAPHQSGINAGQSQFYSEKLTNYIQARNKRMISVVLEELNNFLYNSSDDSTTIKHFLVDIFLQTKQTIMQKYSNMSIPFAHNSLIIELIEKKQYLYEIIRYFDEQFEMIVRAVTSSSNEYIFDDILYYIDHNYSEPLKLETIASLFGYNSSYLGKLFTQKMNQSFNSYLDEVRIKHSVELLDQTDLKVYEIAEKVGYSNVNYFHQKFKKIKGLSPAEYRKENRECDHWATMPNHAGRAVRIINNNYVKQNDVAKFMTTPFIRKRVSI